LRAELERPAPADAGLISNEILRRHGGGVAAVVYYGSCLRKATTEGGVLDFYVLVDSYRSVYDKRRLVWANALLAPNVFYLEVDDLTSVADRADESPSADPIEPTSAVPGVGGGHDPAASHNGPLVRHNPPGRKVRAKYAVISTRDFAHAASEKSLHSIVWSRFSQPALLVHVRDEHARRELEDCLVEAVATMVVHELAFLPAAGGRLRFSGEELWQQGFQQTYRAEFRTEQPETIAALYRAACGRYDTVTAQALAVLEARGRITVRNVGERFEVEMSEAERRAVARRWRARRPIAKALGLVRLVKSALTFGDWVPYALFKLGRHTGIYIEPTERQRRHPFIWGWPVIYRILRDQALR